MGTTLFVCCATETPYPHSGSTFRFVNSGPVISACERPRIKTNCWLGICKSRKRTRCGEQIGMVRKFTAEWMEHFPSSVRSFTSPPRNIPVSIIFVPILCPPFTKVHINPTVNAHKHGKMLPLQQKKMMTRVKVNGTNVVCNASNVSHHWNDWDPPSGLCAEDDDEEDDDADAPPPPIRGGLCEAEEIIDIHIIPTDPSPR